MKIIFPVTPSRLLAAVLNAVSLILPHKQED